jgi:hypothetical protein
MLADNSGSPSPIEDARDRAPLLEQAVRVRSTLLAVCGSQAHVDYIRVVAAALASQHIDGSWGSDDYPRLKPCFTAQAMDMIAHLGMSDLHSSQRPDYFGFADNIQRAIGWLRRQQRSGGWGEDAWDTCQVIKALWKWGVRDDDPAVRSALDYVRDQLDSGWPERAVYWYGPCLPAAALEVFDLIDDTDHQQKALDEIWTFYDEATGSSGQSRSPALTLEAPNVWHTAWALIGLQSFGSVSPSPRTSEQGDRMAARSPDAGGLLEPGTARCDVLLYLSVDRSADSGR